MSVRAADGETDEFRDLSAVAPAITLGAGSLRRRLHPFLPAVADRSDFAADARARHGAGLAICRGVPADDRSRTSRRRQQSHRPDRARDRHAVGGLERHHDFTGLAPAGSAYPVAHHRRCTRARLRGAGRLRSRGASAVHGAGGSTTEFLHGRTCGRGPGRGRPEGFRLRSARSRQRQAGPVLYLGADPGRGPGRIRPHRRRRSEAASGAVRRSRHARRMARRDRGP